MIVPKRTPFRSHLQGWIRFYTSLNDEVRTMPNKKLLGALANRRHSIWQLPPIPGRYSKESSMHDYEVIVAEAEEKLKSDSTFVVGELVKYSKPVNA